MSANIITITREFGSGGRTIGREVAQALGYDFYDWELVEQIARESGFNEEFVEDFAEDSSSGFPWLFKVQTPGGDLSDQLFIAQTRVIRELAEKGNCVIVGRCADYILRERSDVLNCFIFADEESKKKRILSMYGEREESIDRRLKDKARKRKAHYQYYTGRKWGRAFYYDLSLDSGRLSIEVCASLIVSAARKFECTQRSSQED